MSIEQLAIHMDTNYLRIVVYHRPGAVQNAGESTDMTKVLDEYVTGQGQGNPTLLPAFSTPIEIPPYSSHTFYSSGTVDPLSIYYTHGTSFRTTFASDPNIEIKEGWSARFPFNAAVSPTQFNGKSEIVMV